MSVASRARRCWLPFAVVIGLVIFTWRVAP